MCGLLNTDYVKPTMTENGKISVINARHPDCGEKTSQSFVPNDILLDNSDNNLLLITGPNMSGKAHI